MSEPRIHDGLSRQRRWQLKRKAFGLCVLCGRPRNISPTYCDACLYKARARNRVKAGCKPWTETHRGRKPREAYAHGEA